MAEKQCMFCGGTFPHPTEIKRYKETGYVCTSCKEEHLQQCGVCKRQRQTRYTYKDKPICNSCVVENRMVYCNHCGELHKGSNLITPDDRTKFQHVLTSAQTRSPLCKTCFAKLTEGAKPLKFKPCIYCGNAHGYIESNQHGVIACNNCAQHLQKCDHCNTITHNQLMRQVCNEDGNTQRWCTTCAEKLPKCTICRKHHVNTGKDVCHHCEKHLVECTYCGKQHLDKNSYTFKKKPLCQTCAKTIGTCQYCRSKQIDIGRTQEHEEYICKACSTENQIPILRSWRYRTPKFYTNGDGILFGVENEYSIKAGVSINRAMTSILKNVPPDTAYFQHDGTIDRGFELVVHPMSLEFLQKFNIKHLIPKGAQASRTTGMHIHIERDAFENQYHLYKFMRFLSVNAKFTQKIAGRGEGAQQWAHSPEGILVEKAKGRDGQTKYVDVNTKHKDTIEIRIFAGTVTEKDYLANVEFCHALVAFTNSTTSSTVGDFLDFCKEQTIYKVLWKHKLEPLSELTWIKKKPCISEEKFTQNRDTRDSIRPDNPYGGHFGTISPTRIVDEAVVFVQNATTTTERW